MTFLVETSQAGPGNLEVTGESTSSHFRGETWLITVLISFLYSLVNNGQVPTSAQAQGNHTYAISFVPKEPKPHIVELKFNAENVPGSPFKCIIVDAARVNLVRFLVIVTSYIFFICCASQKYLDWRRPRKSTCKQASHIFHWGAKWNGWSWG